MKTALRETPGGARAPPLPNASASLQPPITSSNLPAFSTIPYTKHPNHSFRMAPKRGTDGWEKSRWEKRKVADGRRGCEWSGLSNRSRRRHDVTHICRQRGRVPPSFPFLSCMRVLHPHVHLTFTTLPYRIYMRKGCHELNSSPASCTK